MIDRFNLVDEPWIQVVDRERVSLRDIFKNYELRELGGTAVHKLSILKLLLAIGQTACTLDSDAAWHSLGCAGFAQRCSDYLERKRDLFWLYGAKPFLQIPVLETMKTNDGNLLQATPIGRDYLPDLPSSNDSILFENQKERALTDAEKAVFIVSIMNYSLAGKRVVKNVPPLSTGYAGKSVSAKSSPSAGSYVGYLNTFLLGNSIVQTVWLNLFTEQTLASFPHWTGKPMVPPWEAMPEGEADIAAISLKSSYMSTLCSLSRFVLLKDDGIIYMEGLQYPTHKEGWREPFMTYSPEGKMLWLDMDKKPWRSLTAILSAAYASGSSKFECPQVKLLLGRARNEHLPIIGIWSGGLKFRTTAGDSSVKQDDDYIESAVFFDPDDLGELWFNELHSKMEALELLSSILWKAVNGYYRHMSVKDSPATGKATGEFWSLCEQQFQNLVDSIGDEQRVRKLQLLFARFVESTYDKYCSNESAKQMSAWANNRPNVSLYLAEDKK